MLIPNVSVLESVCIDCYAEFKGGKLNCKNF